jgi:hypothetical protein
VPKPEAVVAQAGPGPSAPSPATTPATPQQPPASPASPKQERKLISSVELRVGKTRVGVNPGSMKEEQFRRIADDLLGELKRTKEK